MAGLPEHLAASYPGLPANERDLRFVPGDEDAMWLLDFHWPTGIAPLGTTYVRDGYVAATRRAAELVPLPDGRGLAARLAGTHLYSSPRAADEQLVAARTRRLHDRLPHLQAAFEATWADAERELDVRFATLIRELPSSTDLVAGLRSARAHQRRAWELHFELMYPLVAGYVELRERLVGWGVEPQVAPILLQGRRTKILDCDRELHRLVALARRDGLADVFARPSPDVVAALAAEGARADAWRAAFAGFLDTYGWRTEGIAAVHLPSWHEDPTPALGTIRTLLLDGAEHDFDAAEEAVVAERAAATDAVRATVRAEARRELDDLLRRNHAANFAWWNDEHNHAIDLRATIPLRLAAVAVGTAAGFDDPADAVFLFWDELVAVAANPVTGTRVRSLVDERRAFLAEDVGRRGRLPTLVGSVPERITDPVLLEIFGLHRHLLHPRATDPASATRLRGLGVSGGRAQGRALVLHDATSLHELVPGEVLVCEATSPNWTPAFAKAAACVCDLGGSLTHAAITAREYGIPCVVGTGVATSAIRTGDVVEVDGDAGTVTVTPASRRA
jgi:phosphohistidine swiveling domain-containing protein